MTRDMQGKVFLIEDIRLVWKFDCPNWLFLSICNVEKYLTLRGMD